MRKAYEGAVPADSFAKMVVFAMTQPEDVDVRSSSVRLARNSTAASVSDNGPARDVDGVPRSGRVERPQRVLVV